LTFPGNGWDATFVHRLCNGSQRCCVGRLHLGDGWSKISRPRVGARCDCLAAGPARLGSQYCGAVAAENFKCLAKT
jgi:hypothetical protein